MVNTFLRFTFAVLLVSSATLAGRFPLQLIYFIFVFMLLRSIFNLKISQKFNQNFLFEKWWIFKLRKIKNLLVKSAVICRNMMHLNWFNPPRIAPAHYFDEAEQGVFQTHMHKSSVNFNQYWRPYFGIIHRVAKQEKSWGNSQATTLVLSGWCLGFRKNKFGPSN